MLKVLTTPGAEDYMMVYNHNHKRFTVTIISFTIKATVGFTRDI